MSLFGHFQLIFVSFTSSSVNHFLIWKGWVKSTRATSLFCIIFVIFLYWKVVANWRIFFTPDQNAFQYFLAESPAPNTNWRASHWTKPRLRPRWSNASAFATWTQMAKSPRRNSINLEKVLLKCLNLREMNKSTIIYPCKPFHLYFSFLQVCR